MEYLFSSFHFQSVSDFEYKVRLLWTEYGWVMFFFLIHSASLCFLIGEFNPFTPLKQHSMIRTEIFNVWRTGSFIPTATPSPLSQRLHAGCSRNMFIAACWGNGEWGCWTKLDLTEINCNLQLKPSPESCKPSVDFRFQNSYIR